MHNPSQHPTTHSPHPNPQIKDGSHFTFTSIFTSAMRKITSCRIHTSITQTMRYTK